MLPRRTRPRSITPDASIGERTNASPASELDLSERAGVLGHRQPSKGLTTPLRQIETISAPKSKQPTVSQEVSDECSNDFQSLDPTTRTERTLETKRLRSSLGPARRSQSEQPLPISTPVAVEKRRLSRSSMSHQVAQDEKDIPLPAPTPRTIPPLTEEGAIASLQPGQYLSATAIELALKPATPEDAFVLDPLWYKLDDELPEKMPNLPESVTRIILPLYWARKSHWTVTIWDLGEVLVYYYDSLAGSLSPSQEAKILDVAAKLVRADNGWRIEHVLNTPLQLNSCDCGVYVTAISIGWLATSHLLTTVDCDLWRRVLHALIETCGPGQVALVSYRKRSTITEFVEPTPSNVLPENLDELEIKFETLARAFLSAQDGLSHAQEAFEALYSLSLRSCQAGSDLEKSCEDAKSDLGKLSVMLETSQTLQAGILSAGTLDGLIKSESSLQASLEKKKRMHTIRIGKTKHLRYATEFTSKVRTDRGTQAEQAETHLREATVLVTERERRCKEFADFAKGVLEGRKG